VKLLSVGLTKEILLRNDPAAATWKKAVAALKGHVRKEGGIAVCNLDLSTMVWLHANSNKQETKLREELQGLWNTIRSMKSHAERRKGKAEVKWHDDNDDNQACDVDENNLPSCSQKSRAKIDALEELNASCGGSCTKAWSVLTSVVSTSVDGNNALDPLDLLPANMGETATVQTLMTTRARDLIVASVKKKQLSKDKQALIAACHGLFAPSMEENQAQADELVKQVHIKCLGLNRESKCIQQAVKNQHAFDMCSMKFGAVNVGKKVACCAGPGTLEEQKMDGDTVTPLDPREMLITLASEGCGLGGARMNRREPSMLESE
jgi:hypothetical protein